MKELAHPMAYTWTNRARRGPAKVERAIPPAVARSSDAASRLQPRTFCSTTTKTTTRMPLVLAYSPAHLTGTNIYVYLRAKRNLKDGGT